MVNYLIESVSVATSLEEDLVLRFFFFFVFFLSRDRSRDRCLFLDRESDRLSVFLPYLLILSRYKIRVLGTSNPPHFNLKMTLLNWLTKTLSMPHTTRGPFNVIKMLLLFTKSTSMIFSFILFVSIIFSIWISQY